MKTENSKRNGSYNFFYKFTDKLKFKKPNKNIVLGNLSNYYKWKNNKSAYSNSKSKVSPPTWND